MNTAPASTTTSTPVTESTPTEAPEFCVENGQLVVPGEPLAVYGPWEPPENGARRPPIDPARVAMVSNAYGFVQRRDDEVSVQSPITIEGDRRSVVADVYAKTPGGYEVTVEAIEAATTLAGVQHGIDHETIAEAIAKSAKSGKVVHKVIVAKATEPVPGEDTHLEFNLDYEKKAGTEDEDGRMDLKERDTIVNVKEGDRICQLVPASEGTAGLDVDGKELLPEPGKVKEFVAADNVKLSDDGVAFVSQINGVLDVNGNKVKVVPMVIVPGDVDYDSGNIHSDDCAVHVKGSVISEFKVSASSHIKVSGTVEHAHVDAGGNITVGRGIMRGILNAVGSVAIQFAQEADVTAGEDVTINKSAMHCKITAGGAVVAKRGKIFGGHVTAGGHVDAMEIGAPSAVPTRIELTGASTEVRIHGTAYAGALVVIHGEVYKFSEDTRRVRVYWDTEDDCITVHPLMTR